MHAVCACRIASLAFDSLVGPSLVDPPPTPQSAAPVITQHLCYVEWGGEATTERSGRLPFRDASPSGAWQVSDERGRTQATTYRTPP